MKIIEENKNKGISSIKVEFTNGETLLVYRNKETDKIDYDINHDLDIVVITMIEEASETYTEVIKSEYVFGVEKVDNLYIRWYY